MDRKFLLYRITWKIRAVRLLVARSAVRYSVGAKHCNSRIRKSPVVVAIAQVSWNAWGVSSGVRAKWEFDDFASLSEPNQISYMLLSMSRGINFGMEDEIPLLLLLGLMIKWEYFLNSRISNVLEWRKKCARYPWDLYYARSNILTSNFRRLNSVWMGFFHIKKKRTFIFYCNQFKCLWHKFEINSEDNSGRTKFRTKIDVCNNCLIFRIYCPWVVFKIIHLHWQPFNACWVQRNRVHYLKQLNY